ncbi:MAG TPA: ATP-binding protein [Candidatus Acidoferrales bacterium]
MSEPRYKILLVEDNPGDARLIKESLSEAKGDPFELETVGRLATGVERLQGGNIDAVLLDLALPDSHGAETFAAAKSAAAGVPIIILTGQGDELLAVKMVQEGAQDFLAKIDAHGNNLSRAIHYAIGRARAEQQILKLNAELDKRVRERTAQLEESVKELEAFSHTVSHDLRAPIRHIGGFMRILLETDEQRLSEGGRDCVARILSAVQSMTTIVNALLKLAQVGRQSLMLRKTPLGSIVCIVLEDLRSESEGRKVEWRLEELPVAECDRGLMKQVFMNLLSNALKYTRTRETAVITIGQTVVDDRKTIFVRDNGVGFDVKKVDRLFGQFQRLHRQEAFEGTGVGLATVQRIIHRHGGKIWAEASEGNGATFFFTGGLDETKWEAMPATPESFLHMRM